jgi:uncharacterized protein YjiS (DUF1127 family)
MPSAAAIPAVKKTAPSKAAPAGVLDTNLGPQSQERLIAFARSHSQRETAAELWRMYRIKLSGKSISDWIKRRERRDCDTKFDHLLNDIRKDGKQAKELAREVGKMHSLTAQTVTSLSQSLFELSRGGIVEEPKVVVEIISKLLAATARSRSADAAMMNAETNRDKMQFDAAAHALANAAKLQTIVKSRADERTKVNRAAEILFGRRPESGAAPVTGNGEADAGLPTGTNTDSAEADGDDDNNHDTEEDADAA